MTGDGQVESAKPNKLSRRDFVMRVGAGVIVGAVAVAGVESIIQSETPPKVLTSTVTGPTITETSTVTSTASAGGFPMVKVANLSDVSLDNPIAFDYPLANESSLLVKLGQNAEGGVGPEGDIVAFSVICQHLGCQAQFQQTNPIPSQGSGPVAVCPCHMSVFDLVNGAKVLSGPSALPLPRVLLGVDESGDIYAYAMGPPAIYGHGSGDDVSTDLLG